MQRNDFHTQNNRVGKLHQFLIHQNLVGGNTTSRIAWFRSLFAEHENADTIIPELDPELHIRFGNALNEVIICRDIVRSIDNYSPHLYEEVFSSIYQTLRNSWENQGHPWVNFSVELAPNIKRLELICDKVANVRGYSNIPDPEQIEEFHENLRHFKESLKASTYDAELVARLGRCADRAQACLDQYQKYSINDFYAALEDIWKEIMMYVKFSKNGTEEERKQNVKMSGLNEIMTKLNLFLGILHMGNLLLSQQNCDSIVQSLSWIQ